MSFLNDTSFLNSQAYLNSTSPAYTKPINTQGIPNDARTPYFPFYSSTNHQNILDHMKQMCNSQEQTITETLRLVLNRDPIPHIIPFLPFQEIQSLSINQFLRIRSLGLASHNMDSFSEASTAFDNDTLSENDYSLVLQRPIEQIISSSENLNPSQYIESIFDAELENSPIIQLEDIIPE